MFDRPDPEDIDGRFLEEPDRGKSPFHDLISWEIRRIERRSGMTTRQQVVFDAWLVEGASLTAIGACLGITRVAAWHHLNAALKKAAGYPHVGMLTVLVETFGWKATREAIADGERRNTA